VVADVPGAGGAEQGIDHGMRDDVGIGMTAEPALVRDLHPAEDQRPSLLEAVAVVPDPDPKARRAHPILSSRRSRPS
jgi:hypothetical protein